jgi:hypothetical protein
LERRASVRSKVTQLRRRRRDLGEFTGLYHDVQSEGAEDSSWHGHRCGEGGVLELDILDGEEVKGTKGWIEELVDELVIELMIRDGADVYNQVAVELGFDH